MQLRKPYSFASFLVKATTVCAVAVVMYYYAFSGDSSASVKKPGTDVVAGSAQASGKTVGLTQEQLSAVKIESTEIREFRKEVEAVGSVVYHEKGIVPESRTGGGGKFVVASIRESDSMLVHVRQKVKARLSAYPGEVFEGTVSALGVTVYDADGGNPAIDPNTHRSTARCEISDPSNRLYPGMLATLTIEIAKPVESVAVPESGVVREGDGTMTAWVTKDRRHFTARTVSIGLQQDGFDQILGGLEAGELVATDGALFIDNALNGSPE